MCPDFPRRHPSNAKGFGLVAAVFVIVILAVFGLLVARYTATTQISSAESYLWAQALYSAETAMRLNILYRDGGGGLGAPVAPVVQGLITTIVVDNFTVVAAPATITVRAYHPAGVSRTVEAKYLLQP